MALDTIEKQRLTIKFLKEGRRSKKRATKRKMPNFPDTPYGKAQHQAWRRKIQWEIPEPEYLRLTASPCSYCNGPIGDNGVRLDRLCSKSGYSLDNVVPCCYRCNMVKGRHLDEETMRKVGKLLQ